MATYEKAITFTTVPASALSSGASSPDSTMPLIEILGIEDIYLIEVAEVEGP